MKVKLTKKKEVYNFCEPYITAEIGSNHNGDINLAKDLIKSAKENGADCVKFQSWTKNSLYSKQGYKDNNLEKDLDKYGVTEAFLYELKKFADKIDIDMTSSPFNEREVDFLIEKLNAPFIKIASMDVNNYSFIEYIASKGLPVVLATGLSELYEIDKAIKVIENTGNKNIVILHCISLYPPRDDQMNLNNIDTLQKLYSYPIGFSDHSLGFTHALAAAAKGVCFIEKHFTLDKTTPGWDHGISADSDELKIISQESKRINKALGSFFINSVEGNDQKKNFRRSIVAVKNIKAGEKIKEQDICFKRPGIGLSPDSARFIIGRIVKKDIFCDEIIESEKLSE